MLKDFSLEFPICIAVELPHIKSNFAITTYLMKTSVSYPSNIVVANKNRQELGKLYMYSVITFAYYCYYFNSSVSKVTIVSYSRSTSDDTEICL